MHADRIRLVRDAIFHHGPDHFDMITWFMIPVDETGYEATGLHPDCSEVMDKRSRALCDPIDINQCGTTACIAGHAVVVGRLNEKYEDVDRYEVAEWLGIDGMQDWLFYEEHWPQWAQEQLTSSGEDEWATALAVLDALIAYGRYPANADFLPDPAHA